MPAPNADIEPFIKLLPDLIAHLAEEHDLVVIGRGSQGLFCNRPGTLHVRIVARQERVKPKPRLRRFFKHLALY